MLGIPVLQKAITRYFLGISSSVLLTFGLAAGLLLYTDRIDLSTLAKVADTSLKLGALVVGSLWALNRYYVQRPDTPRFRVEYDISRVEGAALQPADEENDLLVLRMDVINAGQAFIAEYGQFLTVESVAIENGEAVYQPVYRWPESGVHPGGPIDPDSWSAVSDAIPIPKGTTVVRLYLELRLKSKETWTWHKLINLSRGNM